MAGKENSAMTILMDFAKPCKGKLIGSVILAVLGALCGMIPYLAVSRGIIMICHEDYAFSNTTDLINKVKMQRLLGQQTAACFQRCVGMDALNAVFSTTYEIDGKYGTSYHKNFVAPI